MKKVLLTVASVFICSLFAAQAFSAVNPELPTVAIITTGGTIAEKVDPETGGAVPALSGDDLMEAVPGLERIANIKVINFSNIDSSHMAPENWARLSRAVDRALGDEKTAGAVVTHGTDTMAEGAFFVELTLKSDKPVVFVGAMRNASEVSPDGPANIINAVMQIASGSADDFGVTVTLNQYINSARNAVKTQTTNVQTFDSGEKGYLGYIQGGRVYRYNERPPKIKLPIPEVLPDVALIKTYSGDDGSFIRFAVDSRVKGIVIEGLGAGNVNPAVQGAIKYAIKKGVKVVLATRVYNGRVFPVYGDEGGGATLEKEGVILGGDLTGPKARLLLMLAIAGTGGDDMEIRKYFE